MPTTPPPRQWFDVRRDERADHAMTVLPRDLRSASDARHWLQGFLAERVTSDHADDALLVLSELASNALRHGLGEVVVRAAVDDDGDVQLSVTDSGDELPMMQRPDPTRVGGLGLRIVDRVAGAWGVSPFPGGKTVWATVPRPR